MSRPKLIWRVFLLILLPAVAAFSVVSVLLSRAAWDVSLASQAEMLRGQARLIVERFAAGDGTLDVAAVRSLTETWPEFGDIHVTLLAPTGEVVALSHPERMSGSEESILSGFHAYATDPARTYSAGPDGMLHVYVNAGATPGQGGVVVVSRHIEKSGFLLPGWFLTLSLAACVLASIAGSWLVTRRIGSALSRIRDKAERLASGTLIEPVPLDDIGEFTSLAELLNRTGVQLDRRLQDLAQQRNELDAVLSSMVEGILAVDKNERILSMNRAAAQLFGCHARESVGRSVQETIRNTELQRFIAMTLTSGAALEDDVLLYDEQERYLQVRGTALRNAAGDQVGCVIALHDVTRLKKLERLQREFVANVSHELKTPLTSIQGYVSTLLDGGLESHDDALRFLTTIARQADSLNALIEDLLALSRLEQDGVHRELPDDVGRLSDVLEAAVHDCAEKAQAKGVQVRTNCDPALVTKMNAPLLERALVNLLDNAIKYSNDNGEVLIDAVREGDRVSVHVRDYGVGIDKDHLPRLFERFYRVDRARSRKLGGTGLGLAIVKHIVRVHGGQATVTSEPGRGSTFSIHLPAA